MPSFILDPLGRRDFLRTASATIGILALPAAARAQTDNPVQRLLVLATQNTFAGLMQPDGFWNNWLARFGLPVLFDKTSANSSGPLGRDDFRIELHHRLHNLAEVGARGAAPVVAEAARNLVVLDPERILRGRPFAATSLLRLQMGSALINALIPAMEQALETTPDPLIAEAMTALGNVTAHDVAYAVAITADNGIWYAIGRTEGQIRANPAMANDPALAAALGPPVPIPSVTLP